jgi:tetratricopeptide (TPR) repeat protein
MEIELAERRIMAGLAHNPRDLELLSLHATARFLADDGPGLAAAKQAVLELNPEYTRLYQILGEYADWEHRYDELVGMMRQAVRIDGDDAKALAQLGLNLIRSGNDADGVASLRASFDKDPFNVRVFNTLNLYEKVIPKDYVDVERAPFRIRFHKDDRAILERYVPDLLQRAWQKMVVEYGFTPETPVGVELYAERQNFAVRTSGLPQTAIQGVCFGRTLAAMSPQHEHFNLGMTLWHELAHVFHIQQSKSHVPRWFTEGYAEYETLIERPEWSREHDPDLYEALRTGRLPKVGAMSRAFTRAEELSDIATAYYASSQILVMLGERYGTPKLVRMLQLWGEGKSTAQVVELGLGISAAELDRQFREFLDRRLVRYKTQFVPRTRVGALEQARDRAKAQPKDPRKLTDLAIALHRAGAGQPAEQIVSQALKLDPKLPDARFLSARLAFSRRDHARAALLLKTLVADGHDGYAVQLLTSQLAEVKQDRGAMKQALEAARKFDPTQSEPVQKLALLAAKNDDSEAELVQLRVLAQLEQHDPGVYRRLLELLNERKLYDEARKVGEAAIHADIRGLDTHVLFAEALAAGNATDRAIYELESALVCPGDDGQKAEVHARLAEVLLGAKRRGEAVKHAKAARRLDPRNARLEKLKL